MYAAACEAGCVDLIGYEMSNAPADLARLRAVATAQGVTLVLSYHDFDQTPVDALVAKFVLAAQQGADVA